MFEGIRSLAEKKIWGEHSLELGELAAFIIAIVVMKWGGKVFGKWAFWVGLGVIFLAMVLF